MGIMNKVFETRRFFKHQSIELHKDGLKINRKSHLIILNMKFLLKALIVRKGFRQRLILDY